MSDKVRLAAKAEELDGAIRRPAYLSRVETGRYETNPSLGVAMSIARGLNTNIQDLLGGFKGLTPLGLEAGRLCDHLPASMQGGAIALLRALDRVERR